LGNLGVQRSIELLETTHKDEIGHRPEPDEEGWIWTSRGRKELRRISYLSICRVWTVFILITSRVLRKVLEIVMLVALVIMEEKDNWGNGGQSSPGNYANAGKVGYRHRGERSVKLLRLNAPVIDSMVVLPRLVSPPALAQIKLPLIC